MAIVVIIQEKYNVVIYLLRFMTIAVLSFLLSGILTLFTLYPCTSSSDPVSLLA